MEYTQHKDFIISLRELYQKGGLFQKAATKVQALIYRISTDVGDPFEGMTLTKHGESRIKKCRKYDLTGYARLITISDNGITLFCFAGDHDSCDDWLDRNRGFRMAADDAKKIGIVRMSSVGGSPNEEPIGPSSLATGKLFNYIKPEAYFDQLIDGLPRSLARNIEEIESTNDEKSIYGICQKISGSEQAAAVLDVFLLLRQDKREEAIDRIRVYIGEVRPIDKLTEQEIANLSEGENIRKIRSDDPNYTAIFEHFVKSASYMDWMLFLHPDQQEIVDADYSGPTKLAGVSGSGKTCIVVKRAIRLAEKYRQDKILILTLNRQLACLIHEMVNAACEKDVRSRIEVAPFFTICQALLHEYEPENDKLYNDITWKSKEHIDEVWREYYRCELNNNDAKVLHSLHDSITQRGVYAEQYIREEFDWMRSAVPPHDRKKYLDIERVGRGYPLDKKFRHTLIDGLYYWEKKMQAVGVTDYLGLSTALYNHKEKLTAQYRSVIVDESQDFGTIEYQIIRELVQPNENDLFFSGDAAQQVSAKHRSFKDAGISMAPSRSLVIKKNYRNSREILLAAYDVLVNNLTEEMLDSGDFDILDPEYANFSAAPPLMLRAETLEREIACALEYLRECLKHDATKKGCIAICGYSLYQIQCFASEMDISVLSGNVEIMNNNLYLSDLEHTKGFEFDEMIILNCRKDVLPDESKPDKEQFRDLARFYVAMTRAKNQLIVSYSGDPSVLLSNAKNNFLQDNWEQHVGFENVDVVGVPPSLDDIRHKDYTEPNVRSLLDLSGPEFLYTEHAIGMSDILIEKMRNHITGRKVFRDRRPVGWETLGQALADIERHPRSRLIFGDEGVKQFRALINDIKILESNLL